MTWSESVQMSLLSVGLVSLLHCWFRELMEHTYFLRNSYVVAFVTSEIVPVVGKHCPVVLSWTAQDSSLGFTLSCLQRTTVPVPPGMCLEAGTSEHTQASAVQVWKDLCGALEFIEALQQLDKEKGERIWKDKFYQFPILIKGSSEILIDIRSLT